MKKDALSLSLLRLRACLYYSRAPTTPPSPPPRKYSPIKHEFFAVSQTSNLFLKLALKSTNERRFSLVPIEYAVQVPAEVGLEIFPYIASLVWRADKKIIGRCKF